MAEKESRPLRGFDGITTTDGYFILPRAYFGLVRSGLSPGPVALATFYLYLDGFEKTGRILCPDTRAAAELGKPRRTVQYWKADLVKAGLVECRRGSKYLDISPLKEELQVTAEIQRMQDVADLGGHLKKPPKRAQDMADVATVDKSKGAQDVAHEKRKKLRTESAGSGVPDAQDVAPPIKEVKETVLKDSVKQEQPAARSGSKRASSPPTKKKPKLGDPKGMKAMQKRLDQLGAITQRSLAEAEAKKN